MRSTIRLSTPQSHRAAGVLLGQACGDALGVPYEFSTPPGGDERAVMTGGGLGPYAPGEWSDDTQMAICIARVAATGIDPTSPDALDQIADAFLDWASKGATDIGNQTRAVLSAARRSEGPVARRMRQAAIAYAERNSHSAGNGALMRTSIVGLAALDDQEKTAATARSIAELTHGDPLAGDSCVIWCEAIRVAVMEGRFDARAGVDLVPAERRGQWASWLDAAEARPPGFFSSNGFTVTALQAAWSAILHTPIPEEDPAAGLFAASHFQDALHSAVRIGHDTDTVAAITGGLLGAYWGVSAVPARWRAAVHGWPGLRSRDLVAKAALTARHGEVDSSGWPTTEHIDYPGASHAVAPVPHPYDDGVTLGTVSPSEHQTDVVVSLCRLGTARRNLPPVDDADQLDVWLLDNDEPESNPHLDFLLADTAAYIAKQRDRDRRVYVHCVAAQQRTPSVVLAYACWRGHDPQQAAEAITAVLPSARGRGRLWEAAARVRPGALAATSPCAAGP